MFIFWIQVSQDHNSRCFLHWISQSRRDKQLPGRGSRGPHEAEPDHPLHQKVHRDPPRYPVAEVRFVCLLDRRALIVIAAGRALLAPRAWNDDNFIYFDPNLAKKLYN